MVRGVYQRFAEVMDRGANERVHALLTNLLADPLPGVTDLLPGYVSLYVEYDSARVYEASVRRWLERHDPASGSQGAGRAVEIPVRYDGEDLQAVAELCRLDASEVVARHSGVSYRVYAMGFMPGFPFLGEVPEEIRASRHPAPRKRVPAHSVAMAGGQTGIYPLRSPGGWQLLGRALAQVYDPHREEPFLLRTGDSVRFVPKAAGEPPPEPRPLTLLAEEPERPLLVVREPGLLDLVVDRGRFMVGRFGLARGGALDPNSAALANALVANEPAAPLLEMSLRGPVLEALRSAVVAFAGRGLRPLLNGVDAPAFGSFAVRRGDVLSFAPAPGGVRGYLAVAGGVAAARFAGSSSTDLRGLIGAPLAGGEVIGGAGPGRARPGHSFVPYSSDSRSSVPLRLRLLAGPQESEEASAALTAAEFEVAAADRAGVRLEGAEVPGGEVLSEGVPIGAIQVPPGGSPIILLNDRGTLGGYAKPALLHPADLVKAGQLAPGRRVRFVWAGG